ncbi:glycosyltransferase family 39 protein [Acidipila sp. 4G-K13]|uniref:Glycosyltransferase family 39 protein n=2 Tax=Paracidobacterium acidisoli TaxID=2303751 RepID=A0A372INX4_9BACT|nr:glycosyltransferase family 39 protein [Paracidobacterium acidisoli]MBT9332163.1 glycosyltransferase family 39 protein [Paracidobacterium acidisoli]
MTFRTAKRFLFPLLGLWVLLYGSFSLLKPPLLDDADSVYAEAAREMLLRHDWITPHLNGIRWLESPPLLCWSVAASFRLFGVSDWAARLPLALYALALFAVVFSLGRRFFDSSGNAPAAGFYAALALMTSYGIFLFAHILLPDLILSLWLTLGIACFWRSLREENPSLLTALGFSACCGLGVLTRGLIGIIFPAAIVLLFLFFTRNLRHLRRWHPVAGSLVFPAIVLPWNIAAGMANPAQGRPQGAAPTPGNVHGFWWVHVINEQFLRYLNRRVPHNYDSVPLLIFWALLFVWIVPWCAFSIRALVRASWREGFARRMLDRSGQARLLCVLWVLVVVVFFSFAPRQEYYLLPALPAMALLAGDWLAEDEAQASPQGRGTAWILFGICVLAAATALYFALTSAAPVPGIDIATMLDGNVHRYAVFFGHILDLTHRSMGEFHWPLGMTAAALLVGASANLWYRLRKNARLANCFLAGMIVTLLAAAHLALNTFSPVLSSEILAEAIKPEVGQSDIVVINGVYESGSALAFYLEHPVRVLNGRDGVLWYGSFFSDSPDVFDDQAAVAKLWDGPGRVFLLTAPDKLPGLPGTVYVIGRNGGKEIVSNEPNSGGANF